MSWAQVQQTRREEHRDRRRVWGQYRISRTLEQCKSCVLPVVQNLGAAATASCTYCTAPLGMLAAGEWTLSEQPRLQHQVQVQTGGSSSGFPDAVCIYSSQVSSVMVPISTACSGGVLRRLRPWLNVLEASPSTPPSPMSEEECITSYTLPQGSLSTLPFVWVIVDRFP